MSSAFTVLSLGVPFAPTSRVGPAQQSHSRSRLTRITCTRQQPVPLFQPPVVTPAGRRDVLASLQNSEWFASWLSSWASSLSISSSVLPKSWFHLYSQGVLFSPSLFLTIFFLTQPPVIVCMSVCNLSSWRHSASIDSHSNWHSLKNWVIQLYTVSYSECSTFFALVTYFLD